MIVFSLDPRSRAEHIFGVQEIPTRRKCDFAEAANDYAFRNSYTATCVVGSVACYVTDAIFYCHRAKTIENERFFLLFVVGTEKAQQEAIINISVNGRTALVCDDADPQSGFGCITADYYIIFRQLSSLFTGFVDVDCAIARIHHRSFDLC